MVCFFCLYDTTIDSYVTLQFVGTLDLLMKKMVFVPVVLLYPCAMKPSSLANKSVQRSW